MPKRKKNQQKNFDTSNKLGESHALMQDPEAEEKKKKKGKQKEIFFNQTEVDFGSSEEGSSESEQGSEKEESRIQKKQSKTKINWKAVRGIIHTGKSVSELLSLIFKKAPEILQNDTDCIQLLSLFKGQEVFWLKAFKEPSNIDAVLKLDSEQFFMLLVIFDRLVEAKGNKATQYKKDFCKVLKDRLKFFKQQKVEGIREFVCQAAVQMRAHTSTVQNALKTYLSNTTIYNQIGTSKVKRHMGEVLTLALHKTDNQLTFDAAALQAVMKAMLGASQLTHYLAKDPLNLKRAFIFARIMRRTERFVSILGDLRSTVVNQAALEGWARVYQDIISNSKLWDTSIKEAHGVSKTVLLKALDISLTMASISNVVPGKKREKRFAESEELPKSLERSITPAKKQHVRSAKPLLAQQFRTKNFQKIFSIKNIKNVIDTNKFVGLLKPKRAALRLSKLVNVRKNLGEKTSKAEFNSIIFCLLKYQEEVFEYGSLIQLLEADLNNYSKISDAAYNVFESCQQAFNFLEKLKEQKIHIQIKDASSNVKIIALQVSQLQKARFGGALFLESSLSAARPALIHVSGASKVVDAFLESYLLGNLKSTQGIQTNPNCIYENIECYDIALKLLTKFGVPEKSVISYLEKQLNLKRYQSDLTVNLRNEKFKFSDLVVYHEQGKSECLKITIKSQLPKNVVVFEDKKGFAKTIKRFFYSLLLNNSFYVNKCLSSALGLALIEIMDRSVLFQGKVFSQYLSACTDLGSYAYFSEAIFSHLGKVSSAKPKPQDLVQLTQLLAVMRRARKNDFYKFLSEQLESYSRSGFPFLAFVKVFLGEDFLKEASSKEISKLFLELEQGGALKALWLLMGKSKVETQSNRYQIIQGNGLIKPYLCVKSKPIDHVGDLLKLFHLCRFHQMLLINQFSGKLIRKLMVKNSLNDSNLIPLVFEKPAFSNSNYGLNNVNEKIMSLWEIFLGGERKKFTCLAALNDFVLKLKNCHVIGYVIKPYYELEVPLLRNISNEEEFTELVKVKLSDFDKPHIQGALKLNRILERPAQQTWVASIAVFGNVAQKKMLQSLVKNYVINNQIEQFYKFVLSNPSVYLPELKGFLKRLDLESIYKKFVAWKYRYQMTLFPEQSKNTVGTETSENLYMDTVSKFQMTLFPGSEKNENSLPEESGEKNNSKSFN